MNYRVVLLLLLLALFVFINYKYNNFFIKAYNWATGLPKMLIVFVAIVAILAPALLKNNWVMDYFVDFMPDSMARKYRTIQPKMQQPPAIVSQGNPNRRGLVGGTAKVRKVTEQMKKYVASQQQWKCRHCGDTLDATYEVDHVVALENGGDNNMNNLQALCRNCHGKKTMGDNMRRKYPDGQL